MKTKSLKREQLRRLETEAIDVLRGLEPYVKETQAEPTTEQFEKIRKYYSNFRMQKRMMGSERSDLEIEMAEKVSLLTQNDQDPSRSFESFWREINSFYQIKGLEPRSILDKLEGRYADLIYEYFTKHTLYELRYARLVKKHNGPLKFAAPYLMKVCIEAIERSDLRFFERVGDILRKRQFTLDDFTMKSSVLQKFLLFHWIKEFNGVPPLYSLSQNKLLEVCEEYTGASNLTWENVEKARQRLGLLTVRK
jgi:hypothetical protein